MRSILGHEADLNVVGEASDGLEAVQKAQELQPDLIVLDIGLPGLNGIEAARQIRQLSPNSTILFVSEYQDLEIAEEALRSGGAGYVIKSDGANELVSAIHAVLDGKLFVSDGLANHSLRSMDQDTGPRPGHNEIPAFNGAEILGISGHHEVGFYSDERFFLEDAKRFIGTALRAGNAVIAVLTESHRETLLLELQDDDLDMGFAIEEGRFIALDAADALSKFMVNEMPDPVRLLELIGDLIMKAGKRANGQHRGASIFGECVQLLWAQGNAEAAIQIERLCNELIKIHDVDIFCGYCLGTAGSEMDQGVYQQICAEHSAVYCR